MLLGDGLGGATLEDVKQAQNGGTSRYVFVVQGRQRSTEIALPRGASGSLAIHASLCETLRQGLHQVPCGVCGNRATSSSH